MSKKSGWIPIDKNIAQCFAEIKNRPFSRIEALVSYTLDVDNNCIGTINGYSKLWGWSREKVKKFISELPTPEGHVINTGPTPYRHPIHFIDKGLWSGTGNEPTSNRQQTGTGTNTTTNPNPDHNNIYISRAETLKDIVNLIIPGKKIHKKTLNTWANTFRLMVERDDIPLTKIDEKLEWYKIHWDDNQYIPVIHSAPSFRKKYDKLTNAMKREGYKTGHFSSEDKEKNCIYNQKSVCKNLLKDPFFCVQCDAFIDSDK